MKRILAILLSIILTAAFFTACQATPEKPVVIQKDIEQMIEKAAATDEVQAPGISLMERTGAPLALNLETTEGSFTLSVDAPVSVPDAEKMPVIRVKAGEFTQEQVTACWNALAGDTVLLQRKSGLTKSEIEAKLVILQKSIAEHEGESGYEGSVDETKTEIDNLRKQYDSAPEKIEMEPAESALRKVESSVDGNTYTCEVAGGYTEDYSVCFSVQNLTRDGAGNIINDAKMGYSTKDSSYNYGQVNTLAVDENTELDELLKAHIKTSPAEAKKQIENFLEKMDMPFEVSSMRLRNDEETGTYDGLVAPAAHYAYSIYCKRVINGVLPAAQILGSTYVDNDPKYMREWSYESLGFMVNDSGIISMDWDAPLEIVEAVVEDSTLMPFSDIQAVFEKMMPITFEATAKGMDNLTCNVSDVRLEMMRVVEQDSVENGLLIPVWNFYGVRSRTNNGKTDQTGQYILMCINAVDGSVIDISKGY